MKQAMQKQPRLYLSTSEGNWRVILDGMPLCADTNRINAVYLYTGVKEKTPYHDNATNMIWNGDLGTFTTES
jgi:hypothetical protein